MHTRTYTHYQVYLFAAEMKYIFLFCAFGFAILLISFESSEFTYPDYFPKPVYNFSQNPLKKEIIQLKLSTLCFLAFKSNRLKSFELNFASL
jgi:hypothetical protein